MIKIDNTSLALFPTKARIISSFSTWCCGAVLIEVSEDFSASISNGCVVLVAAAVAPSPTSPALTVFVDGMDRFEVDTCSGPPCPTNWNMLSHKAVASIPQESNCETTAAVASSIRYVMHAYTLSCNARNILRVVLLL